MPRWKELIGSRCPTKQHQVVKFLQFLAQSKPLIANHKLREMVLDPVQRFRNVRRVLRVAIRESMKRYQIYMPFQHETHWLLYKIKIYVKFKNPIFRLPNFRMKPAAIFCAVPKTGTMSVHKALEETLGSFFHGGRFLYAPDIKTLGRAQVYASRNLRHPAIIGIGHQHALVLVESGLMSFQDLSHVPVFMIERDDRERFSSAMRYCQAARLLPPNFDEQKVRKRIQKRGHVRPKNFDTSIRWGVPIHFSPSHLWQEGLPLVISFSIDQLLECINNMLQLAGHRPKLERVPRVNDSQ